MDHFGPLIAGVAGFWVTEKYSTTIFWHHKTSGVCALINYLCDYPSATPKTINENIINVAAAAAEAAAADILHGLYLVNM